VKSLRDRQASGELDDAFDPRILKLALTAMITAPAVLPHLVHQLFGVQPDDPAFTDQYARQLARIIELLGPSPTA
jgi:hypothetical protein